MSSREERVARNEKQRRDVNLELEQISEQELHAEKTSEIEVLCECGRSPCFERIKLSIAQYDAIHSERDRFLIAVGHELLEIESVVGAQ